MPTPTQVKKDMQKIILEVLERDEKADIKILTSSLALQTGFTPKPILRMFEDMAIVGLIQKDRAFLYKNGSKVAD